MSTISQNTQACKAQAGVTLTDTELCLRTSFVVHHEMRRHRFSDPERDILEFVLDFSLRVGEIDAVVPRQAYMAQLIGMKKSHISTTLKTLISKTVLIPNEKRYEIVLDSKRWNVRQLYPLTKEHEKLIEWLYRRSSEQFPLKLDGESLHDSWQRLILAQCARWVTAQNNLMGGSDTRYSAAGSGRTEGTGTTPLAGQPSCAAPDLGTNRSEAGVQKGESDGWAGNSSPAQPSSFTSDHTEPGSEGNRGAAQERMLSGWRKLREQLASDQKVTPGVTSENPAKEKSYATGNFLPIDGQKVTPHVTFPGPQPPEKLRHAELSDEKVTPQVTFGEKSSALYAGVTRTRAQETVKQFKQCTENSLGKQCATAPLKQERWRNNPTVAEIRILKRIEEFVGIDAVQWQVMWLNEYVRTFPHEVIECAVEDCILIRKQHGDDWFKTRNRDGSPAFHKYLKGTIHKRHAEWLKKQSTP